MPKSTTFANDLVGLIFNATSIASIARDAAVPLTNLCLSLHTGTPGIGGAQTTNEVTTVAYPNYTRINVARTAGGWTVGSGIATLTALAAFPQSGSGTGATLTHVAIGTDLTGAGKVLYAGSLNANLNVANLIQPQFQASSLTTTET